MTALAPHNAVLNGVDTDDVLPALLQVERSVRGLRWVERLARKDGPLAETIAQRHGLPQLLSRLLAARGVTVEGCPDYLDPTIRNLMADPSLLQDMDAGAERFARAIRDGEKIAIFGDYDVDGAASTALMTRFLRAHGIDPAFHIPDRMTEGYGPNEAAFTQFVEDGATLIMTVDCGTMSHGPVAHARNLGADVIVIDHHLAGERLPDATALINPNRQDDISGLGDLAAAGVTFLFLVAVARLLRQQGFYGAACAAPDLRQWLDLVALATVCDVVPLTGLNRAYVVGGLKVMRARHNTGLRVLGDTAGLGAEPNAYHLGFVLGPRINAGGRIGDSGLGTRLLVTDDDVEAARIAGVLDRLNAERKAMESDATEAAVSQADYLLESVPDSPVLIVHDEGWHRGVVGLVASRLTERYGRPTIAISWEEDGTGAGSARSIPGVDIGRAIAAAVEEGLLVKGGGHSMAAGLTIARDGIEGLKGFLDDRLANDVALASRSRDLRIDGALMPSAATLELLAMLEKAGPYGSGNPRPRFVFAAHRCSFSKVVGGAHVRCSLSAGDGSRISAVAFRSADTPLGALLLEADGMPLHVAGHLRRNQWGGRESVELVIEDAARIGRK